MWCIGSINGQYIARMEGVLDFYNKEVESGVVRLAFDERPCQLLANKIEPLPMESGKSKRIDSEYEKKGTCNVLLAYNVDQGQRYLEISKTRKKSDFARFWDNLVSQNFEDVKRIDLLVDNLNTHDASSFYEHLDVQRADELRRKINFIYTPKKGSWLNVSEIEFSALSKQCLDGRRIPTMEKLETEALAWCESRNSKGVKINWTFTKAIAREKFKRHYKNIIKK